MNTKSMALKARIQTAGEIILPLQGRCMDPLLVAGDRAKIVPTACYLKGYLYLFELPDESFAVHRLIAKSGSCVTMKGDRSRCFETVLDQNILGMVSEVKLLDCEAWSTIKQRGLIICLVVYLSKRLAKDKNNFKDENKIEWLINKVCSKLLIAFSYWTRKHWERNCRRKLYN